MKKVLIGMAVHNNLPQAIETIGAAVDSCVLAGLDWKVAVTDDKSRVDEQWNEFNAFMKGLGLAGRIVSRQRFCTNPNLGRILNRHLTLAHEDGFDYYLNVESDVFCRPGTVNSLLAAMRVHEAPVATCLQLTPGHRLDLHYYGKGIIDQDDPQAQFWYQNLRPKWCNLGCLLVGRDVIVDRRCRVDEKFVLWCVDGDFTAQVAQHHGRPLLTCETRVVHHGNKSTLEGSAGTYNHLIKPAVEYFDSKWADYLAGGLF
jgi:hypothetical protein